MVMLALAQLFWGFVFFFGPEVVIHEAATWPISFMAYAGLVAVMWTMKITGMLMIGWGCVTTAMVIIERNGHDAL
jgi:hypothetical protein